METITITFAFGYRGFGFADFNWRRRRPALTQWFNPVTQRDSLANKTPA